MKKLLLFLLLFPVLINAQILTVRDQWAGKFASMPLIARTIDTIYLSDVSDKRSHLLVDMGNGEYSAVIVQKITIGNVPTAVYMPSDYDATKKYPVWLFLHGLSEMAKDKPELDRLIANGNHAALLAAAEKYKFIVVAPQLVQSYNEWTPGWTNKTKYLQPVYDFILNSSFTDKSHIVVTGLSLGGGGTWVVCTGTFAPYISAAVPICGTPQYGEDFSLIAKYNIPIWAFHAKDDKTVAVEHTINTIAEINKYSPFPPPKSTILNTGGHSIWGSVYSGINISADIYNWALPLSNSGPVVTPPEPVPIDEIISTYKVVIFKSGKVEIIKQ
jgi:predicted peptidase